MITRRHVDQHETRDPREVLPSSYAAGITQRPTRSLPIWAPKGSRLLAAAFHDPLRRNPRPRSIRHRHADGPFFSAAGAAGHASGAAQKQLPRDEEPQLLDASELYQSGANELDGGTPKSVCSLSSSVYPSAKKATDSSMCTPARIGGAPIGFWSDGSPMTRQLHSHRRPRSEPLSATSAPRSTSRSRTVSCRDSYSGRSYISSGSLYGTERGLPVSPHSRGVRAHGGLSTENHTVWLEVEGLHDAYTSARRAQTATVFFAPDDGTAPDAASPSSATTTPHRSHGANVASARVGLPPGKLAQGEGGGTPGRVLTQREVQGELDRLRAIRRQRQLWLKARAADQKWREAANTNISVHVE